MTHYSFIYSFIFYILTDKKGVNIYFEKASEDESGPSDCCVLYMSFSAAPHFLSKNKNPYSVSASVHEWKTEHS